MTICSACKGLADLGIINHDQDYIDENRDIQHCPGPRSCGCQHKDPAKVRTLLVRMSRIGPTRAEIDAGIPVDLMMDEIEPNPNLL